MQTVWNGWRVLGKSLVKVGTQKALNSQLKIMTFFPEGNGVVLSMGVANVGFSPFGEEKRLEPGSR